MPLMRTRPSIKPTAQMVEMTTTACNGDGVRYKVSNQFIMSVIKNSKFKIQDSKLICLGSFSSFEPSLDSAFGLASVQN